MRTVIVAMFFSAMWGTLPVPLTADQIARRVRIEAT